MSFNENIYRYNYQNLPPADEMNIISRLTKNPDFKITLGLGFLFFVSGLTVMLFVGSKNTLSCDRSLAPAGACTLRVEKALTGKEQQIPIPQLKGAYVDESTDSDGTTYRVVLQTARGEIPFTSYYSSGYSGKKNTVDKIIAFLQDENQAVLSVKTDSRIWVAIFSGIYAGVGAVLLISTLRKLADFEPAGESV